MVYFELLLNSIPPSDHLSLTDAANYSTWTSSRVIAWSWLRDIWAWVWLVMIGSAWIVGKCPLKMISFWLGGTYGEKDGVTLNWFFLRNWLLKDGPWNDDDPPYPCPWEDFHGRLGWFRQPELYVSLNDLLLRLGLRNVLSTFACSALKISNPGHFSTKWSWLSQRTQTRDITGLDGSGAKDCAPLLISKTSSFS